MNERSFIVKRGSDPASSVSEPGTGRSHEYALRIRCKNVTLPRKLSVRRCSATPSVLRGIATGRVSGFSIRRRVHVVRHNRSRLRCGVVASEWIWSGLADELEDRGNHTQNARDINRRFRCAPAFLF